MRSSTAAAATSTDAYHYTSASPSAPATAAAQGRSKRWATHSVDEHLSGDEEQEDQDLDDEPKPRSKRARASNASNASSSSRGAANSGTAKGTSAGGGGSTSSQGPVSANDKEQRKQARMIRNRNAAQASRDRKKEHTQYLESRVAQLEAQLGLAPTSSAPSAVAPSPSTGPRSNRSNSISSLASNNTSTPRVTELEEENELLRTQLHSEQMETARLRGRLESLEDKFSRFEQFMAAPLSTAAPDPLASLPSPTSFAPASTTPAPFEPTFAFDTVKTEDDEDLPLLPIHHHASLSPRSTRGRIIPAAEAVGGVVSEDQDDALSQLVEETLSAPPTPPPGAATDLLHLDDFTVASAWGDWANGLEIKPEVVAGGPMEEDDLTTEFLDFSYLQDAPVVC
ncbi:hypothetical protein BCR35DRAFT_332666 [Leucosporidium creatinivorum]|uniref:BZIP domain-containing protein n=1 Tax=Leucosporidium creatinivorum TaxID=106004 RepID=A0A1Y2F024_9BASI|nr:hypothetical protein BCR35DRAFT_332666 [Leucosporidium creatinivorum]